jgi:CO/xanthine dehydrogenase FAD-binding subunit
VKPAPFEYDDPRSLGEALELLDEHGDEAKVLAGGQSLVPLLNFRLARPGRLIDVNRIDELGYLRFDDGTLRIGALTRHAALEHDEGVGQRIPLLAQAVRLVGHAQIRNRGTVGGSVAHADPAAELPVAFAALDARYHVRSRERTRVVGTEDMFVTHLTTSLAPEELLVEIEVPVPPPRTGAAVVEFSRRHGDFALGGAAVLLTVDGRGACEQARIALLAAAPTPVRASDAESWLRGIVVDESSAAEAAERAVAEISPTGDIHGSTEYRRGLVETMVRRALLEAVQRA